MKRQKIVFTGIPRSRIVDTNFIQDHSTDEVTIGAIKVFNQAEEIYLKVQMTTCDSPNIELAPCKVYLAR